MAIDSCTIQVGKINYEDITKDIISLKMILLESGCLLSLTHKLDDPCLVSDSNNLYDRLPIVLDNYQKFFSDLIKEQEKQVLDKIGVTAYNQIKKQLPTYDSLTEELISHYDTWNKVLN